MVSQFKDIIVAVHGIGAQRRSSTIRSVATQLAASETLLGKCAFRPIASQPLGYFHALKKVISIKLVDDSNELKGDLAAIGFTEVFWADIPQGVVREGRTLEETKAWARTVVARANALYLRNKAKNSATPAPDLDFSPAADVIDEIIETVYVLERLFFLADRAGLFKFDLHTVLKEYLGDVQLVTEFSEYRSEIVGRFTEAMEGIYREQCIQGNTEVRIHIIAHSEGTVVSFLGLLQAMSLGKKLAPDWLRRVHGYMTIGSPIDKHLLLWDGMWKDLEPQKANEVFIDNKIHWRNYYDYGDPIGFKLKATRLWLKKKACNAFEFCGCKNCHHDIGFARYFLPGKAHNDYWQDPEVFEHFVRDVIKPSKPSPPLPAPKRCVKWFSPVLPYFLSFLLLAVGVFIFQKTVIHQINPDLDPAVKFLRFHFTGLTPPPPQPEWVSILQTFGLTALIAGTTLLTLFARLTQGSIAKWGVPAFLVGSAIYALSVLAPLTFVSDARFNKALQNTKFTLFSIPLNLLWQTLIIIFLALFVAFLAEHYMHQGRKAQKYRKKGWFFKGIRPLIIIGFIASMLIVLPLLYPLFFRLVPDLISAKSVSPIPASNMFSNLPPELASDLVSLSASNRVFKLTSRLASDLTSKLSSKSASRASPVLASMLATNLNSTLASISGTISNEHSGLEQIRDIAVDARFSRLELEQLFTNNLKVAKTNQQTVIKVQTLLNPPPSLWRVLLSAAAFLYLWWLAALVFDMAFVWQRYVRNSLANSQLQAWNSYGLPTSASVDEEQCTNPDPARPKT